MPTYTRRGETAVAPEPLTPAQRVDTMVELMNQGYLSTEQARELLETRTEQFDAAARQAVQDAAVYGTSVRTLGVVMDEALAESPDTHAAQYGAAGNGDYLFTIPDTGLVLNTARLDPYEDPRVKVLSDKIKELEEKLAATVAFYEGMVDEELGASNDDSSGS